MEGEKEGGNEEGAMKGVSQCKGGIAQGVAILSGCGGGIDATLHTSCAVFATVWNQETSIVKCSPVVTSTLAVVTAAAFPIGGPS